jgi:hypothetical protein
MKIKKILKVLLIVFAVFYVLQSPNSAAGTLRGATQAAYHGAKTMAESATRFFDALLKR